MQSTAAPATFLMTLKFDHTSFDRLQAWRVSHFPPARNYIPAHLTLFHTLDDGQVAHLQAGWPHLDPAAPIGLHFARPRFLGGGVAIDVESPGLAGLRARCMVVIGGSLTRQDQSRFRPHVTIQNKVDAGTARSLYDSFTATFVPWNGEGTGLMVWRYRGGPWEHVREHRFGAGPP